MKLDEALRRPLAEGAASGLLAGVSLAVTDLVASAVRGDGPLMALRLYGSVVAGRAAVEALPAGAAALVGVAAHLLLSAVFGMVYGSLHAPVRVARHRSIAREAGYGVLFGLVLWAVNFHVVARLVFPWFLETPLFLQAVLHALAFGLPLALGLSAGLRWEADYHHVVSRSG